MSNAFYVGDLWDIEVIVTNPKTGKRGEPGEVTLSVYSPAARLPEPTVEPKTVTATKVGSGETTVYEATGIELDEAGQWLAVVNTTAPYQGREPVLISVAEPK